MKKVLHHLPSTSRQLRPMAVNSPVFSTNIAGSTAIQLTEIAVLAAMFVENTGLFTAIGRSWRLVEGKWWRTFFILLLVLVLNYVVSLALGAFLYLGQILLSLLLSPYLALAIYEGAVVLVSALVT